MVFALAAGMCFRVVAAFAPAGGEVVFHENIAVITIDFDASVSIESYSPLNRGRMLMLDIREAGRWRSRGDGFDGDPDRTREHRKLDNPALVENPLYDSIRFDAEDDHSGVLSIKFNRHMEYAVQSHRSGRGVMITVLTMDNSLRRQVLGQEKGAIVPLRAAVVAGPETVADTAGRRRIANPVRAAVVAGPEAVADTVGRRRIANPVRAGDIDSGPRRAPVRTAGASETRTADEDKRAGGAGGSEAPNDGGDNSAMAGIQTEADIAGAGASIAAAESEPFYTEARGFSDSPRGGSAEMMASEAADYIDYESFSADYEGSGSQAESSLGLSVSLDQEVGYNPHEPANPVVNLFTLGARWEQLLGERFFVRLDGESRHDLTDEASLISTGGEGGEDDEEIGFSGELKEAYLQTNLGSLSITAGKQIIAWGKSDTAIVTDIISPRDLSDPVSIELEDIRLGQKMLVFDYFYDRSQLSLIVNPDARVNRLFLPVRLALAGIDEQRPDSSFSNPEVGLRWSTSFQSWDLALMAADVFEDNPIVEVGGDGSPRIVYPRYQMLGGGFNYGNGLFVWKGELAFKYNRRFNRADFAPRQHSVWDAALGFDFDPNGAYLLTLELANQYIDDWDSGIQNFDRNSTSLSASLSKNFLNETVTLGFISNYGFQDQLHYNRLEYTQRLNDLVAVGFHADVFYSYDDGPEGGQQKNLNRLTGNISIDF
ncbi:MAG: hypothetical protein P8Y45_04115 [Exilibacterium sp.]